MDFSLFWCFLSQLTGTGIHIYRYLEPLCNDHRKLRQKITDGSKFVNPFLLIADGQTTVSRDHIVYLFRCRAPLSFGT